MKIYWSAFLSLLFLLALAGCGGEQFGSKPESNASKPSAVTAFEQASCSQRTLIKPQVDILYIVDNSTSTSWVSDNVKSAIQGTINSISSQFDYRVIGTPLLKTADGDSDYQVLATDPSSLPTSIPASKKISSYSQFNFFKKPQLGNAIDNPEVGLRRLREFLTAHQNDGLFRQQSYLLIVLASNGRDTEIEPTPGQQNTTLFNSTKTALLQLKSYFQSQQFRLMTLTANTSCQTGYWESSKSYAAMSQALYDEHTGFPAEVKADHYDICGSSVNSVFTQVNSTIQQVIIPHKYKYWPMTVPDSATGLNDESIKVYKSSPNSAPVLLPSSSYNYISNPSGTSYNTRIEPSLGEPTTSKHLIEFTAGNEVVYPECIQISSTSNPEYFGYIVIAKPPKLDSVVLKINGNTISQSSTNGWSYIGMQTRNIKVSYQGFSDTPAALRTGYMIQLNGGTNYYRSGDNVEIYYLPNSN